MKVSTRIKKQIIKHFFEVSQASTEELEDGITSSEKTVALCRKLAAEGCVLVENDGVLPINKEEKIAVFGRCAFDYFYVGYGSGGDVKPPYRISPMQAFEEAGVLYDKTLAARYDKWRQKNKPDDGAWGCWPMCYEEMPLTGDLVADVRQRTDKAIVFIGRSSGEDRESIRQSGSWYLTQVEEQMLSLVTAEFDKVCVVLNCGSIFDTSWIRRYGVKSVLYAWQGGQESGRALVDVLTGKENPSGKLTDTIAEVEDYPSTINFGNKNLSVYNEDIYVGYRYFETFNQEAVKYPFGFGKSYTTFNVKAQLSELNDTAIKVSATVINTGSCAGKEVVQVYMKAPEGRLGKPKRELIGFAKTHAIKPGEQEELTLEIDLKDFASYDDTGLTGHINSYILEAGDYEIYVGTDVRSAMRVESVSLDEKVIKTTLEVCPPDRNFERLISRNGQPMFAQVNAGKRNLKERIKGQIPVPMNYIKNKDYRFQDVINGGVTLDEFIATLDAEALEALSRGSLEAMNSPYGAPGNAAAFGGTNKDLQYKGIPAISTNDGPSGCRLQAHSTLFPIGVVLASSFNQTLIEETFEELGNEVIERNSQVLLAPGMNIHRNPLCGRNFEYFSEDPYLTGKIGAAYVRGVQKSGCSAVAKHVCCNNQETGRIVNNAVVSQRALREIYIKGFEICIKEAKPDFLMTSYNKVNGIYTYYNYDLCTELIRNEFNYEGVIMTDWWMQDAKSPEFPSLKNQAYRVRAGNNLYMPGATVRGKIKFKVDGSVREALDAEDGLSLGELQRNAKYVLTYIMKHMR